MRSSYNVSRCASQQLECVSYTHHLIYQAGLVEKILSMPPTKQSGKHTTEHGAQNIQDED